MLAGPGLCERSHCHACLCNTVQTCSEHANGGAKSQGEERKLEWANQNLYHVPQGLNHVRVCHQGCWLEKGTASNFSRNTHGLESGDFRGPIWYHCLDRNLGHSLSLGNLSLRGDTCSPSMLLDHKWAMPVLDHFRLPRIFASLWT